MAAISGAIEGWRGNMPVPRDLTDQQRLYAERWALYDGTLFRHLDERNPYANDPTVYRNSRLLWKHSEAIGDFYASSVYPGEISTTGLLAGTAGGAVPLVPQVTGDNADQRNEALARAYVELMSGWNWQQNKALRPLYGAILGDCLTELIDDTERRFIYPQIVWPGYVTDLELDYVGNLRAYTLEYDVFEKRPDGSTDQYRFRKEVTKEEYRYYKNDQPWDRYGTGSVVRNIYGFVPAIWDRHRIGAPGQDRGRSALDGSRQAIRELNSIFSHALDFQRKAFYAPVMIATRDSYGATPSEITTGALAESPTDYAEMFDVLPVPDGSQLLQAQFDVGKTGEMLDRIQAGILDEAPEAAFYQRLRDMQTVTRPGAMAAVGDVEKRLGLAADGYDAQTVKLFQMAVSMAGYRVQERTWSGAQRGRLSLRQQAFVPFDLGSYDAGDLDTMIEKRDLITLTETEKLELLALKEGLQSRVALMEAWDNDEAKVNAILRDRNQLTAAIMGTGALAGDVFGSDPRIDGDLAQDEQPVDGEATT